MISFCIERFQDTLPELKEHLDAHWQELALDKDKVPLDPIWQIYFEREDRGELLFVGARNEGKLVGYFIGFVAPGLHYKTCLTLTMDIFWLHPDYRGHGEGFRLFKFVEQEAKNRGVNRMFVGSKLHKDVGFLFEKLGYREVERYYSAWIGD